MIRDNFVFFPMLADEIAQLRRLSADGDGGPATVEDVESYVAAAVRYAMARDSRGDDWLDLMVRRSSIAEVLGRSDMTDDEIAAAIFSALEQLERGRGSGGGGDRDERTSRPSEAAGARSVRSGGEGSGQGKLKQLPPTSDPIAIAERAFADAVLEAKAEVEADTEIDADLRASIAHGMDVTAKKSYYLATFRDAMVRGWSVSEFDSWWLQMLGELRKKGKGDVGGVEW